MVPDFAFLMPWDVSRVQSHSIAGLFGFCLPVGLLSYWVFEYVVKPAAWEVLPDDAHERSRDLARPDPIGSPLQWLLAAAGILAGAVTHLVWDAFTHPGTRGERLFPALRNPVDFVGSSVPAFEIVQQLSSFLGLALVIFLLWRDLRRSSAGTSDLPRVLDSGSRHRWMQGYVAAAILFCAISVKLTWMTEPYGKSWSFTYSAIGVGALRGLLFSLLTVSALLRARLAVIRRR